jgi:adenylylsulfate kinase
MVEIIFITGVSGAGKTTLGVEIKNIATKYNEVVLLDGDIARTLWPELGMSKEDRKENINRIANLSIILSRQFTNSLIIISCIAPFKSSREKVINKIKAEANGFKLVYVHAPLIERIKRDPKGLYDKAIRGEIENLTGYDGRYDIPTNADFIFDSSKMCPTKMAERVLK